MSLVPPNQLPIEASEIDTQTRRRRQPLSELVANLRIGVVPADTLPTEDEATRLINEQGPVARREWTADGRVTIRPRMTIGDINALINQYIRHSNMVPPIPLEYLRRTQDVFRAGVICVDGGNIDITPPLVALNRLPVHVPRNSVVYARFDRDPRRTEGVRVDVTVRV